MKAILVVCIVVGLAAPALAAPPHTVLFISPAPGTNKVLAAAVIKATYKAAITTLGKSLIVKLRPLGPAPQKLVTACGSDLSCIAKLGDKLEADRVLIARLTATPGGGASMAVLVIGVVSETIEQRFTVNITRASETEAAVTQQLVALDSAEGLATDSAPAPEPVKEALPPTVPQGTGSADSMNFGDTDVAAPPAAATTPPPTAKPELAPGPRQLSLPPELQAAHKAPAVRPKWLLPTGLATTVVGLGGAGVGFYFGSQAQTLPSSIHYGAGGTTQVKAQAIGKQASQDAVIADALFVGGGVIAAVGLALLGVDLFAY